MQGSLEKKNGGMCVVCYGTFADQDRDPSMRPLSLDCGHQFCLGCWVEHLKEKIHQGPDSLKTKCQANGCNMIVQHSLFLELFKDDE